MSEKVVSVDDLVAEPIDIVKVLLDERGSVLFIGSLSADDFVEWNETKEVGDPEAKRNAAALLITRSLVKSMDDPTRIGTPDMVAKFRKIKVAKSERLLKAIFKLNNINQKDEIVIKNS